MLFFYLPGYVETLGYVSSPPPQCYTAEFCWAYTCVLLKNKRCSTWEKYIDNRVPTLLVLRLKHKNGKVKLGQVDLLGQVSDWMHENGLKKKKKSG